MTRVILFNARNGLHALFLISAGILLALGAAIIPAEADNGSLYVAPGPSSLISADIVRRNQDQLGGTGRKLGDLIGSSLKSPAGNATALVVTTKCGHYVSALITYPDGSVKSLSLSNAPATQNDMDKAKAAIPVLRFVDIAGCDG
jgi:hypothetical protein